MTAPQQEREAGAIAERERIAAWLYEDAEKTRDDLSRMHRAKLLTPAQTAEWEMLIGLKVGIADAISRNEHKG